MRKRLWFVVGFLGLLLAAGAAWRLLRVEQLAEIGAGYTAQQTCACLFVSRRPLESCRMDLERMARWFISVKVGDAEVKTRAFGLAAATSRYQAPFGCSLIE